MVDHCLDLGGIENTVFAPCDQIIDCDRSGDFVTEHSVEGEDGNAFCRGVDQVCIKNFLC